MLSVIYAESHSCYVLLILSVIYVLCHLCFVSFMLSLIHAESLYSDCHYPKYRGTNT
jgi:hypothetical protein